jgi:transposase-like protein
METEKMFVGVSIFDFGNRFTCKEDCLNYLSDIKWPDGYKCRRCDHNKYCETARYGERRCTKCGSVESPTAHTLFHKVKFPLLKAFYIIFYLSTSTKGMSTYELARKLGMRQGVVWRFKRKVMLAMKSSGNYPIAGEVVVDETTIGGKVKEKRGRSQSTKKQVVVTIQKHPGGGISRAYAQVIQNAGSKQLLPFIDHHIAKGAHITTDKWRGYSPLARSSHYNLTQIKSAKGENFPLIHIDTPIHHESKILATRNSSSS